MKKSNTTQLTAGWPQAKQYGKSIRVEFSIYLAIMILLPMAVLGWVITEKYVSTITQHVAKQLLVQARSFSGTAINHIISTESPDQLMLNNICNKLASDNPDIYWAGIADTDRRFLAHTDIRQVVMGRELRRWPSGEQSRGILNPGEALVIQGDTMYLAIPIEEEGINLGYMGLASSLDSIADARRTSIVTVATITLILIALGIPLTLVLFNRKLRPIRIITESLRQVSPEDISLEIPYDSKNEFGFLAATLKVMGTELRNAYRQLIEKERISNELRVASEIQASILPGEYPRGETFESYGAYQSAREVGGDYYDFIDIDDQHLAIVVADVSGKSLPAMLFMLMTRDIIKKLILTPPYDPAHILTRANSELKLSVSDGVFVSMFFGILNKRTGRFFFASAGHTSLITLRDGASQPEIRKTRGYPLGLVDKDEFRDRIEDAVIDLGRNDWLILYTDGLTDSKNAKGETFSINRLVDTVKSRGALEPARLVEQTMRANRDFAGKTPQFDDITLVALKWRGAPEKHSESSVGKGAYATQGR